MTKQELDLLTDDLAGVAPDLGGAYYAVQGLRRGAWHTLFAPYLTGRDANAMRDRLARDNPQCRYQTIRVETVA